MKPQIRLHLPTSCPDQRILRIVLDRIPQLATYPWGVDAPQPANPACHHDGAIPAPDEARGKASQRRPQRRFRPSKAYRRASSG
ncbi:hypothetical protein [Mesorhizobium sp. M0643]|uniref:hypothetical protein n=1 Tax=Mesorhizobium sp. M0643 TaxID=2956978 RepID=UPI0033351B46